ncbi:MAG: indole-3-glycerol phosphate synthase TrpC [Simkaniaceae bacterium]|nr:indole-3-glycerol phosphate synthase TrpC [Simkaniaceae bacterium]
MENFLDKIVKYKGEEARLLRVRMEEGEAESIRVRFEKGGVKSDGDRFADALRADGLSVIAELKRRSPSAGSIGEIADPGELAKQYEAGGASALSVLTDEKSFGGSLHDLGAVRGVSGLPVLRKDFTVDVAQIAEAWSFGADAVLLIVAVLQEKTGYFVREAERMGMETVVEVVDQKELDIALAAQSGIILVNNRDLHTFKVDPNTALRLKETIPPGPVSIAASGMKNTDDTKRVKEAGFDAVLIGQTLVESADPAELIRKIRAGE